MADLSFPKKALLKLPDYLRSKLNPILRWYYTERCKITVKSYGKGLTVNRHSQFNSNTYLGKNNNFNGLKVRGGGPLTIGDNFHSGPGGLILTRNHNYEGDKIPYDQTYIEKEVTIEDNVWIGANVIILPGVTINEGAIIQAGAVVANDIPKCGIAGGSPAEVFKYRDKDHYERLKSEGKFH